MPTSDSLRYSTRKRNITNYNEDNAELWGLSEDDDDQATPYTAQAIEEEGDVIESVHDHRRKEEFGMHYIIRSQVSWKHRDLWNT